MIKYKNFLSVIFIFLYRILLDYVYVTIIYPIQSYAGIKYLPIEKNYIISWVVLIIVVLFYSLLIPSFDKAYPSTIIVIGIFNISFISGTTLLAYTNQDSKYIIAYTIYWINLLLVAFMLQYSKKLKYRSLVLLSSECKLTIFYFISILFLLTVFFVSYKYRKLQIDLRLNVQNALRIESRNFDYSFGIGYILNWSKILFPFLIYVLLKRKKFIIAIIVIVFSLLLYGIDGKKSVLFNMIIAIIAPYLYTNRLLKYLPIFLLIILLMAIIENIVFSTNVISAIVVYRIFILPSHLSQNYYDFFSKNGFDYFRQSIMRYIGFKSKYEIPVGFIIGANYDYYDPNVNSNNGLFGDAFMNFGFLGVIIMPILFYFAFKIYNYMVGECDEKFIIIFLIPLISAFINGPFFTVMLTNGFLISIILLRLFFKKNRNISISNSGIC